jgi:hypothetical protein
VDAQVEIVTRTANGEKVRLIARQNTDVGGGSSRLKAMKVCPVILTAGAGGARGVGEQPLVVCLHHAVFNRP